MLLHMYQVFSSLLGHFHFSLYFFSTFIEQLFNNHPIFRLKCNKIALRTWCYATWRSLRLKLNKKASVIRIYTILGTIQKQVRGQIARTHLMSVLRHVRLVLICNRNSYSTRSVDYIQFVSFVLTWFCRSECSLNTTKCVTRGERTGTGEDCETRSESETVPRISSLWHTWQGNVGGHKYRHMGVVNGLARERAWKTRGKGNGREEQR